MNNEKLLKYLEEKIELKKQDKTELATQKIELGAIDDFTKVFEKAVNEDLSIGNTLISALSKAEGKYKAIISDYENAIKLGDKATEFAKELGVDLPSTFKNKMDSSKAGIKEARTLIGKINQLYSAF
jgi:tetratricopeptide (TPR) repeat protein